MESSIEITNLISPLIKLFKKASDEWKNYFDMGLSEYLQSQTEKYYFTNTFLHRNQKVRFNEIYYPINASYNLLKTDFKNLDQIFSEYKNITIIGAAGSGKTTLLKSIFLNSITDASRIPILIELRKLNEYNGDFEKLITENILKSKIKPNDEIFKRTLESGKFLFLLDGYDEIFSIKKQEINRQIELFVDSYSKNRFLITTRPGSGIENFSRFYDFRVCSLDDDDVEGFISKIVKSEERRLRIVQIIKDPLNENYIEYLRNPLLLSMFILAFESHPEIPTKKSAFYRNVFDTLYSKHDGINKNSFPREKMTNLQRDDFEKNLSIFSYLSLIEGKFSFTYEYLNDTLKKVKTSTNSNFKIDDLIYDLRTSISILILDGFEYSFPHRSMQEYFTALFISGLPTDKKNLAYKNLSTSLENSSTDNSFNFWSLCQELDESNFTSSFLIPYLKKFKKILSINDNMKLLNSFLELSQLCLFPVEMKSKKNSDIVLVYQPNIYTSIVEFCNVHSFIEIMLFPMKIADRDKIKKLYFKYTLTEEADDEIRISLDLNDEIKEILISNNFIDLIKSCKSLINMKIAELEKSLKIKNENIDYLLGN